MDGGKVMELLFIPMAIVYFLLLFLVIVDFVYFMIKGGRLKLVQSSVIKYFVLVFTELVLFDTDTSHTNDCCGGWTLFSPAHRLSIYVLMMLCMAAYIFCNHRKKLAPPMMEVVINCLLLTGIVLYGFIGIQINGGWFGLILPLPALLLFVMALVQNHLWVIKEMEDSEGQEPLSANPIVQFCWFLLRQPSWKKFPVLVVLCLPLLFCVVAILLLFGQRPDSLVRAFTDTYRQGLSQLEIDCNSVQCGGHFLCTIAAKGHERLVRPVRAGVRAGGPIKCNRQLLISNAFEEWLEQRLPALHRPVRRLYNHVGTYLHRHYGAFDRKWVSDLVYLLMKPLEWIFLLTLYLVDRHPENRIAQQYMSRADRAILKTHKTMIHG